MSEFPDPTSVVKTPKGERLVYQEEFELGVFLGVAWDECIDCNEELDPDGKLVEWHVAAGHILESVESDFFSVAEEFAIGGWERPQWMIDLHNDFARQQEEN